MSEPLLAILFLAIALLYSSIGFGGGSSYLAILSLVLVDFYEIRSLALILNIVVVSIGTYRFARQKVFHLSAFWPFVILSIPAAFLGARLRFSETVFFIVLGSVLLLAAAVMIYQSMNTRLINRVLGLPHRLSLGGSVGFLSGMVGIGGGIFLSPLLNMIQWKDARIIASLASFFILINSLSGLVGLSVAGTLSIKWSFVLPLLGAVAVGGIIGSSLSLRLDLRIVRLLTAFLVMYVGLRLILQHGFGITI